MNSQSDDRPDEATLTLWMDGGLEGDALEPVEAWARDHPELLEERAAVQAMSASIKECVPDSIEPPYPDFFNQRILRHIDDGMPDRVVKRKATSWQQFGKWLAIPVAASAMAVCFYLGVQVGVKPEATVPMHALATVATAPKVYTPDGDVRADMFKSKGANAVVIVLEGLKDIPDDYDIVHRPRHRRGADTGAVMVNSEMNF